MPEITVLWLGLILTIAFLYIIRTVKKLRYDRHRIYINQARKILKKLQSFNHDGEKISYLRKIDPFVFEELILCAYESHGHSIIRNKRYTGDGGIDGQVIIDGQLTLIQAKRYSSHINARHVKDFSMICHRRGVRGVFIHTGKTGEKSYRNTQSSVRIISGSKLLELLKTPS